MNCNMVAIPQIEELVASLVFVLSSQKFMITGLPADDATFSALCSICTNPEYVEPLECTHVVHYATGDIRYLRLVAPDPDTAHAICMERIERWLSDRTDD